MNEEWRRGYTDCEKYRLKSDLNILLHFIEAGCSQDAIEYIKLTLDLIEKRNNEKPI